jgi:glyoxylase-like metal-dependent hydrolase (beta-lactamase superfamily II)
MLVVRQAVVGPFAENTYLAGCSETGEAILVDPGGEAARVLAMREPGGMRIRGVFLTHGHVDHAAGVAELQRRLGELPCSVHEGDRRWIESLPHQLEMFGFEEGDGAVPAIARFHADGDEVRVGRELGRVLHTPGHSAGGCCLVFPAAKVVFTGDTLFAGSVGRTDLPGGDFEALAASIRDKLFPLGDDVQLFPGHGPAALLGDERRGNPFVGEAARRGRFL